MQLRLPILQPLNEPQNCASNPNRCVGCPIKARGECPGCDAVGGTKRCGRMASCETNCGTCGGYNVDVPAVCVKSPVRDMMIDPLMSIRWDDIPKGRVLNVKNKAICIIAGGRVPIFRPSIVASRYDHVDAVGVSMAYVWSKRGWKSSDLKDYLGLPNRVKLIVTTTIYDDKLEHATNEETMYGLRDRSDIDFFLPLQFSSYTDDSMMQTWFSWKRTLRSMEETGGDFIFGDITGITVNKDVLEGVKRVPQVVFYSGITDGPLAVVQRRKIAFWHKVLPKTVAFFFVGPSNWTDVGFFKRTYGATRPVYFMSATPWMVAHKGKEYSKYGKHVPDKVTVQDELTVRAFENYSWLVANS